MGFVVKRDENYSARFAIPKALRPILGQNEFKNSLGTRILMEIYDWNSRSVSEALKKEERDRKYRLLPNGKMIAGMKLEPGQQDNCR